MRLREFLNSDFTPNWNKFESVFSEMSACKHSNRWHKEGSPLEHTKLVTNEMIKKLKERGEVFSEYNPHSFVMICAAMFHDIGKPSTTYYDYTKQDWCCKDHGREGERIFRDMFKEERLDLREQVAYLIRYHMMPHYILSHEKERQEREIIQMTNCVGTYHDLLLLNECDLRGSISDDNTEEEIICHISSIEKLIEDAQKKGIDKIYKDVNEFTPRMYVMIGIPGSGKTTLAKKISVEENNIPIISRDDIRHEIGFCKEGEKCVSTKEGEDLVTCKVRQKIQECAKLGISFIVDNTSLRKTYRQQYQEYIKEYNIAPIYVYVEAPSLEDNYKRREHQIAPIQIKHMWKSMEFPTKDECYMLKMYDQKNDAIFSF